MEKSEHQLTESDKKSITAMFNSQKEATTPDELKEHYKIYLPVYHRFCDLMGYRQNTIAGTANKLFELYGESVCSKVIIDIGTGTGIMGEELSMRGCKIIDGLDVSKDMIDLCKSKDLYRNLFEAALECTPTKNIEDNAYDAAISTGCYLEGHIPLETLVEVSRMVKRGGYIVYTLNDPNFKMNYIEIQGKFMKEGRLQLISMELIKYRREVTLDFDYIYAYLVVFKVLK